MNKLEIEIPEGKEIDWQESAKQEEAEMLYEDGQYILEDMTE